MAHQSLLFAAIFFYVSTTIAYSNSNNPSFCRRTLFLQCIVPAAATVLIAPPVHNVHATASCTAGTGDDCAALAQDNPYIQELQQRSAAKREEYERQTRDAYYRKNYPDYFKTVGKTMVRQGTVSGPYVLLTDEELAAARKAGKIVTAPPPEMSPGIVDVTQKGILILKN